MKRKRLTSILSGVAGEYFVAAELSRLGYVASVTLRNTKGIDVLASNDSASRTVGIQVKTNQAGRAEWMLKSKVERHGTRNLFFVFVRLNESGAPKFHVVARQTVANEVRLSHKRWLRTPGRNGQKHKENPVRKFRDADERHLNNWKILGLD